MKSELEKFLNDDTNENTDTDRLNWMIKNKGIIETSKTYKGFYIYTEFKNTSRRWSNPREAIDAAMRGDST